MGGRLEIKVLSKHKIKSLSYERMTVLPNSGTLVVSGYIKTDEHVLDSYRFNSEQQLVHRGTVELPCEHFSYSQAISSVMIGGKEFVVCTCYQCHVIRLLDVETGEFIDAFTADDDTFEPWCVCPGEPGRLWVMNNDGLLIEFDCTSTTFKETGVKFSAKVTLANAAMDYIPAPTKSLIICGARFLRAVSCETGQVLFESNSGTSAPVDYSRVLLHPHYRVLLVACWNPPRIDVMDPTTGTVLQSIPHSPPVLDVCWMDGHLMLLCFEDTIHCTIYRAQLTVCYPDDDSLTESLALAFDEACKRGVKQSFRGRINIIGHSGVGKTSLTRRLLGEAYKENLGSTDGIETHRVEMDLDEMEEAWKEADPDLKELVRDFNEEVISKQHEATVELLKNEKPEKTNESREKVSLPPEIQNELKSKIDQNSKDVNQPSKPSTGEHTTESTVKPQERKLAQEKDKTKVKGILRLLDFGGQTEFYTTHHIFLDAEAINVIVVDVSKGLKEAATPNKDDITVGIPKTAEEFFSYWMRSIEHMVSNPKMLRNVVLVLTHKDNVPEDKRQQHIDNFKKEIQEVCVRNHLPQIPDRNIHVVDNKTGTEADFRKLRAQLYTLLKEQKNWDVPKPVMWLRLEAAMCEMRDQGTQKPVKYMRYEEVKELAKPYGMNDEQLMAFLQFHHQLGEFVYFPDKSLKHIVITDPQWLVEVFKTLITAEEFIKNRKLIREAAQLLCQGKVTQSSLQQFWEGEDVDFLIELMEKFGLMLPLMSDEAEDKIFFIPCMLPEKSQKIEDIKDLHNLELIYKSKHTSGFDDLLPVGMFSKLMSECSKSWPIRDDRYLCHRFASFCLPRNLLLTVAQTHGSTITASIWYQPEPSRSSDFDLSHQLAELMTDLDQKLKTCKVPPTDFLLLLCPYWKPDNRRVATVKFKVKMGLEFGVDSLQPCKHECPCHERPLNANCFEREARGEGTPPPRLGGQRRLTEEHLLDLSKYLPSDMEIRSLGLTLGVNSYFISGQLNSYRSIQTAAHEVLLEWRRTAGSPEQAWKTLGEALLKVEFNHAATKVLNYPPPDAQAEPRP